MSATVLILLAFEATQDGSLTQTVVGWIVAYFSYVGATYGLVWWREKNM